MISWAPGFLLTQEWHGSFSHIPADAIFIDASKTLASGKGDRIAHQANHSSDLGYAPPFSPPDDLILIAAGELKKKVERRR